MVLLWEVSDEFDVSDDQLVLQQQVLQELVFIRERSRVWTQDTVHQAIVICGDVNASSQLLRKAQRLQNTILRTWREDMTSRVDQHAITASHTERRTCAFVFGKTLFSLQLVWLWLQIIKL